ncbi:MAG: transcriptional regulator [Burkholderiales bacterium]|nr:transcriptional regulator [Burkholderiales bacterium]
MKASALMNVNPLLADRARLAIMASLSLAGGPVDFNTLLEELELTKGNLSSHMRKLEDAELVTVRKEFVGRKPRTTYVCTRKGKSEMRHYLSTIEALLKAKR